MSQTETNFTCILLKIADSFADQAGTLFFFSMSVGEDQDKCNHSHHFSF
jgi:hypothetical protein